MIQLTACNNFCGGESLNVFNQITRVDLVHFNERVAKSQLDIEQHLAIQKKQVRWFNLAVSLFSVLFLLFFWLNIFTISLISFYLVLIFLFLGITGVANRKLRGQVTVQKPNSVTFMCHLQEKVTYEIEQK